MSKKSENIRFVIFLCVATAFLLFAHYVVFIALVAMLGSALSAGVSSALEIALGVLALGFIGASVLSSRFNNILIRAIYCVEAVWLGFFAYLFMAAILYGIASMTGLSIAPFGQSLFVIAIAAGIYGLFHARSIKTNHIKIALPHLPASWQGRKAVFVSDIHLGHVNGMKFAGKVAAAIRDVAPDIIFIGGDLYDGVKVDENAIIAPFAGLKPSLGTFFVTGNHEEFEDSAHFINAIERAGIRVLLNEVTEIDWLQIVGVTDRDSTNKKRFAEILTGLKLDRNRAAILLKHQPSDLAAAAAAGISLQLSGHTHRAQQWPLNTFTHWIFKGYDYGQRRFGAMSVYTSSGVGTWGPPLRVGTDAEIVVIEFVSESHV